MPYANVGAPIAIAVCDFLGIRNRHFVDGKGYDPKESLTTILYRLDGPADGVCLMYRVPVWKKAESLNCSVILSGFGGDECLSHSGSRYPVELAKKCRLKTLFHYLQQSGSKRKKSFSQVAKAWITCLLAAHFPRVMRCYSEWRVPFSTRMPMTYILKQYENPPQGKFPKDQLSYLSEMNKQSLKGTTAALIQLLTGRDLKRAHYLRRFLNAHDIACKEVSYRYPLLDVRLIEFVLRIPPEKRYPCGSNRYLMRQLLKGLVPDVVADRQEKAGSTFPSTYYQWLKFYEMNKGHKLSCLKPDWNISGPHSSEFLKEMMRYRCFLFEFADGLSSRLLKKTN